MVVLGVAKFLSDLWHKLTIVNHLALRFQANPSGVRRFYFFFFLLFRNQIPWEVPILGRDSEGKDLSLVTFCLFTPLTK